MHYISALNPTAIQQVFKFIRISVKSCYLIFFLFNTQTNNNMNEEDEIT